MEWMTRSRCCNVKTEGGGEGWRARLGIQRVVEDGGDDWKQMLHAGAVFTLVQVCAVAHTRRARAGRGGAKGVRAVLTSVCA
jgi:hypothetical protein